MIRSRAAVIVVAEVVVVAVIVRERGEKSDAGSGKSRRKVPSYDTFKRRLEHNIVQATFPDVSRDA